MSNGEIVNGGKCRIGENGCVAVQGIKINCAKCKIRVDNNTKDIIALEVCVEEIKRMLFKGVLLLAGVQTIVQVIFKYIKL